ncbi:MAG TPA: YceD family protein [Actinomycetota bacterium]
MSLETLDVRDLMGQAGATRTVHLEGTLDDLGTELAHLRETDPVQGDVLLESLVEGILVSGRLTGTMSLSCARCLKAFEQPFSVDLHEMFVPAPEEDTDDYPLDPEGLIDPEQMVRDAVGVELPFSPLHTPDCKGLCPVCGGDRNLDECPGEHPSTDPRWAELDTLLQQMDQN